MLRINDQVFVDLRIDDKELPSGPNVISNIIICEGNLMKTPQIKMVLGDSASVLAREQALTDGNPIRVLIARSEKDADSQPLKFRVFGGNSTPKNGQVVTIVGTIDAPEYVHAIASTSFEGNSEAAVANLCKLCNVPFDGPTKFNGRTPNDSQIWLSVGAKYSSAIQDIVAKSWVDESSVMSCCMDLSGTVIMRNLFDVANTPLDDVKVVFVHGTVPADSDAGKRVIRCADARDRSLSGFTNSFANYGSAMHVAGINGVDVNEDKMNVNTRSKGLAINKDIYDKVSQHGARVEHAPLDCGNTNERYHRASFQNTKGLALFSQRLSVLVYEPVPVKLYEPVAYRQANLDVAAPIKQSDVYVVIGRTKEIRGGRFYAERLELAKPGVTMTGSSNIALPDGVGSSASMIPNGSSTPYDKNKMAESLGVASSVTGMNSAVRETTGKMEAAGQLASGSIGAAVSPMRDMLNSIDSGVASLESSANSMLESVQSAYDSVEGYYRYMKDNVSNVAQMVISLPSQLDSNARSLLAGVNGGIMDMLGSAIPVINQNSMFGRVFDKVRTTALQKASGKLSSATFDKMNAMSSKLNQQQSKLAGAYSDAWNNSVGVVDKKAVEYGPSNSMYRLSQAFDDGTVSDKLGMRRAIASEIAYRPVNRNANWMDANSVMQGTGKPVDDANLRQSMDNLELSCAKTEIYYDA